MAHEQPEPHFHFLDLPPELRNRICEQAVTMSHNIKLPEACRYVNRKCDAVQPALTHVNRQIRRECLPIFYHSNIFQYDIKGCDFTYFIDYMEAIGLENRKCIQNVCLMINDRLSCGEGLFDYVRWCTRAEGTENMVMSCSGDDWHDSNATTVEWALSDAVTLEEYLDDTMAALNHAVLVGQRPSAANQTREVQIRLAWEAALYQLDFLCFNCQTRAAYWDSLGGVCSRLCRLRGLVITQKW